MRSVTVSQQVAAPVERVFAAATDFAGAASRISGIRAVRVFTDGPTRVGTRFEETRVMFGREAKETMEVVALDPPRSYVLRAESHGCRYRTELRFTPRDGGTLVEMEFGAEPLTLAAKVMSVLFAPMMKSVVKLCGKDLADLARHCEAATPGG
jgi:uncharacterized protein YndB with AHSA1/START domain